MKTIDELAQFLAGEIVQAEIVKNNAKSGVPQCYDGIASITHNLGYAEGFYDGLALALRAVFHDVKTTTQILEELTDHFKNGGL